MLLLRRPFKVTSVVEALRLVAPVLLTPCRLPVAVPVGRQTAVVAVPAATKLVNSLFDIPVVRPSLTSGQPLVPAAPYRPTFSSAGTVAVELGKTA